MDKKFDDINQETLSSQHREDWEERTNFPFKKTILFARGVEIASKYEKPETGEEL